jgi:hypothetical protein
VSTLSQTARAILVPIFLGCATLSGNAQSKPQSVCNLPQLAPGAHQSVRIAAIAESGTDMGVLTDASCPSVQPTWFELSLRSERNRNKLHDEIEKSGKAAVVLTGELFGPQQPDPQLPSPLHSLTAGHKLSMSVNACYQQLLQVAMIRALKVFSISSVRALKSRRS